MADVEREGFVSLGAGRIVNVNEVDVLLVKFDVCG